MRTCLLLFATFALITTCTALQQRALAQDATMGVKMEPDGATITVNGELFTRYLPRSFARPVLWPIIGPTGEPVTRSYSVGPLQPGEAADHAHHTSLWFGYEGINGVDFWVVPESSRVPMPIGTVAHREFIRADSNGRVATVGARNDYLDPSGRAVAHDERIIQFGADDDARWIDVKIRLWSSDGPLVLGDTKEGAFAVRVAGSMKVDAREGGGYVSSNGDVNGEAWGKAAEWVDYHGPVNGETVGIAILTHPSSDNPKPRWHVREYGLFAANPIGAGPYTDGEVEGGLEKPEGEPLYMRYRVLIHKGDAEEGDVAEAFARYARAR